MKLEKILLLIFVVCTGLSMVLIQSPPKQEISVIEPGVILHCEQRTCPEQVKPDFLEVLEEIHDAREWEENYNCKNFSKDYIKEIEKRGYSARYVVGKISPDAEEKHAWVELTIVLDPTAGKIVKPSEGYYVKEKGLTLFLGILAMLEGE